MRLYLITILLIFVLESASNAQTLKNDGLVLTASLTSVKPKLNTESAKPVFRYELQFIVQIRNDSNQTLIVFKPTDDLVQKRVAFMFDLSEASDIKPGPWIAKPQPYRSFYIKGYDPYAELIRGLDLREPFSSALLKLGPGLTHEYIEVITVEDGYRLEIKPGQSLSDVASNPPLAEDPSLRIQYHLSLKKRHANDDFLKTLQTRWKRFGHLVLDGAGDFSLTSEIIINRSGN